MKRLAFYFIFLVAYTVSFLANAANLEWKPIPDAKKYVLEISETQSFNQKLRSVEIKENVFQWQQKTPGQFFYRIAYIDRYGRRSPFSQPQEIKVRPPAPQKATAQVLEDDDRVLAHLTWDSAPFSQGYEVQVSKEKSFSGNAKVIDVEKNRAELPIEATSLPVFWRVRTRTESGVPSRWNVASPIDSLRGSMPKARGVDASWDFRIDAGQAMVQGNQRAAAATNQLPSGSLQANGLAINFQTSYNHLLPSLDLLLAGSFDQLRYHFRGAIADAEEQAIDEQIEGLARYNLPIFRKVQTSVGGGFRRQNRFFFQFEGNTFGIQKVPVTFLKQFFQLKFKLSEKIHSTFYLIARQNLESLSAFYGDVDLQVQYALGGQSLGIRLFVSRDDYGVTLNRASNVLGQASVVQSMTRFFLTYDF